MTDARAAALRDALDVDELVETARELVACASVNPPGDEREVADRVAARLASVGARDVEFVEAAPGRVSVLARWGATGGRVLVWNGHVDVVAAGDEREWRHPPFAAEVADGRLWGRGAADMKGSVACVVQALALLGRAGVRPRGELVLQVVADEETGGAHGSGHLAVAGRLPRADGAICGEPTSLRPLTAARGRLWLDVTTLGASAHAAQPQLGRNAISAMRKVLDALARIELPREVHPLVGAATLTPTTIRGGTTANTVPDRCTLSIDRRFLPSEDVAAVRGQIDAALAALDVDCVVEERALFTASDVDPASEVVVAAQDAAELVLGERPPVGGMPGSTDARFLVEHGIPTVIFGPGDVDEAHTVDESIAIDELERGALAYAALVCRFLGVDGG